MGPRDGWLQRDGTRLHYLDWHGTGVRGGPSTTPVFLLHGLSSNARFWARFAARFEGRRIIALDQRSHGLSDRAREGDALETFVADVAQGLASVAGEPALLVGHSWGAAIALEVAAAHPELCTAL